MLALRRLEHAISATTRQFSGRIQPAHASTLIDIGTRDVMTEECDMFRKTCRDFLEVNAKPYHDKWEEKGMVDRAVWRAAGETGLLGVNCPTKYGGSEAGIVMSTVLWDEVAYSGCTGLGMGLHNDIVMPYLLKYGSEEQKQRWVPAMCQGEKIAAIAMSEPGAGSDLQGIKTTAVKDGDDYIINGSKIFITNGHMADLVVVVAKTDPSAGAKGITLFVVEEGMEGFSKGRILKKVGMKAQDTSELFFDNVRVPASHLLGGEGKGFYHLMSELPQERLLIGLTAIATAEVSYEHTRAYVKERKTFGKPLLSLQTIQHKMAELKTQCVVGRTFIDSCLALHAQGKLDASYASMAKYWTTDLQCQVLDECVQLHGGYGFMWEYPIARAWADARAQRIYGGTNEIMKELIARTV
eukprot:Rmarinus@m.23916